MNRGSVRKTRRALNGSSFQSTVTRMVRYEASVRMNAVAIAFFLPTVTVKLIFDPF